VLACRQKKGPWPRAAEFAPMKRILHPEGKGHKGDIKALLIGLWAGGKTAQLGGRGEV